MTPLKETRRAEGRDQPEGSLRKEAGVRTQSRVAFPPTLARVNAAAGKAARTRFTALLHRVDTAALERAFRRQKRQASAGIDGMTVAMYELELGAKLTDLCARIHTGRYDRNRCGASIFPKPMAGSDRSAYRRLRTRSSKAQSPKY